MNLTLLFGVVYIIWLLSEILLNRLLHSGAGDKQHADKNTLSIIWLIIIITIFLSVFISVKYPVVISAKEWLPYAGLGIIIAGMLIRLLAVYSLGRFFTVDVTIRKDHRLKKDGLYKYLRHPSYFASFLSFVGFGISLNNWLSLLLIIAAIFTAFVLRIKVEEKILTEQFGPEYLEYKKSTYRLIPFLY